MASAGDVSTIYRYFARFPWNSTVLRFSVGWALKVREILPPRHRRCFKWNREVNYYDNSDDLMV